MYCWPSVSIKRGARLVVGRKVIIAEFEWTFGYLLISIDGSFASEQVTRVITSKNDQFIDPVHEVSFDSPLQLCQLKVYFNFYFAYLSTLCLAIFCPRNIRFS